MQGWWPSELHPELRGERDGCWSYPGDPVDLVAARRSVVVDDKEDEIPVLRSPERVRLHPSGTTPTLFRPVIDVYLKPVIDRAHPAGRGPFSNNEIAALIRDATGEDVSYTTIWKLRNGQAQNPQKRLIEALARTFGVPPAFFFDDYDEQAGLLQDQVELLALVRDARISSAQLRAILELSPQARQAIVSLVEATARDDTRRRHSEHDETG